MQVFYLCQWTHSQHDATYGSPRSHPLMYWRLMGRLTYLTLSWPDITFDVHRLSQFMSNPREPHFQTSHHLLRYLKCHLVQGLLFPSGDVPSKLQLQTFFFYFDWGTCPDTRCSVVGFCVFLGNAYIYQHAKKQISRSSAELLTDECSVYRARLSSTASELIWIC